MRLLGGTTVAAALARPENGFAVTRLALALAVVVSHAFSVTTGRVADEPLTAATGFTLGEHAVNGFFAVSGFLVTMSFERRGWRDYALARLLRIAPGLVAATLAVALILGGVLSRLPLTEYLAAPGLWRFVRETLTSFKSNAALPGLFPDNPFRSPMGTVWTLKYEVLCYAGLLGAGVAGLLRARVVAALASAGLFAALLVSEVLGPFSKGLETALRLPFLFTLGATLYLWRDRVPLSWVLALALAGAAALLAQTPAGPALLFAAAGYGVVVIALSPALARPGFDLRHDLSYGIYLYGWPLQQALRQLWPSSSSWELLGPALASTVAVAALSWFAVERPALALKARLLAGRPVRAAAPVAPR